MEPVTVAISLHSFGVEKEYRTFPVTPEGVRDAVELLDTPMAEGHRYGVSPWQFDGTHADALAAAALLRAGDVGALAEFARTHAART